MLSLSRYVTLSYTKISVYKAEMTIHMIVHCWVCLNGLKGMEASHSIQYKVGVRVGDQIQAFLGEMTNGPEPHFICFWNKVAS